MFRSLSLFKVSHEKTTLFTIRFKVAEFYPFIRRKPFTVVEIFSFVGGLLGLFLGVSVLSIVEVFCYLICKPFMKLFETRPSESALLTQIPPTRSKRQAWENEPTSGDYTKYLTVHSFKFIADGSKCWTERFFWIIAFILSMIGCVFMILQLYQKLNINSIKMTIEDRTSDIMLIPFPGITFIGNYPLPRYFDVNLESGEPRDKDDYDDTYNAPQSLRK